MSERRQVPETRLSDTLQKYLRAPDRAFWAELFQPAPEGTEADVKRRMRVTRYTSGAALVLSLFYVALSSLIDAANLWPLTLASALALIAYAVAMWLGSLGLPNAPRRILIYTLALQLGISQLLTDNYFLIVVYVPLMAALARILVPASSRKFRIFMILYAVLLFAHAVYAPTLALVDLSRFPDSLLHLTRFGNAVLALGGLVLLMSVYEKEVLVSEQNLQLEKSRSDALLNAVLPTSIADELRHSRHMIANRHPAVTVLFADIAGFTPWSAGKAPEEVVEFLEKIFSRFDQLVSNTHAEKIKTIGDAYMVISGAPAETPDHARHIAELALKMMAEIQQISAETGVDLSLRIGIHSGPVIAGVIGSVRFSYDVWGDTVNTASRMESHGVPGRIQITAQTRAYLGDAFQCEERGTIEVKGKGPMTTWWLEPTL